MGNPEENRNRTGKGTGEIPDLKLTARTGQTGLLESMEE